MEILFHSQDKLDKIGKKENGAELTLRYQLIHALLETDEAVRDALGSEFLALYAAMQASVLESMSDRRIATDARKSATSDKGSAKEQAAFWYREAAGLANQLKALGLDVPKDLRRKLLPKTSIELLTSLQERIAAFRTWAVPEPYLAQAQAIAQKGQQALDAWLNSNETRDLSDTELLSKQQAYRITKGKLHCMNLVILGAAERVYPNNRKRVLQYRDAVKKHLRTGPRSSPPEIPPSPTPTQPPISATLSPPSLPPGS